jgi:hypothetical protein
VGDQPVEDDLMGVTEDLAKLVVRARCDDLTAEMKELSKWAMMDGVATTLAGRVGPAGGYWKLGSGARRPSSRDCAPQWPPNATCLGRICQRNDGSCPGL